MNDYKELLDELRSKWLFPCNIEAADLIERLIRERDEARAKAIDEAAAICRAQTEGVDIEEGDWHAGWTQCAEACADEILARTHGYD